MIFVLLILDQALGNTRDQHKALIRERITIEAITSLLE